MVASFAANEFVALVPALAVMLGANMGTTLIGLALSLSPFRGSLPDSLLAGVVMFRTGGTRTRDVGLVVIGLGRMLIALSLLGRRAARGSFFDGAMATPAGPRDT